MQRMMFMNDSDSTEKKDSHGPRRCGNILEASYSEIGCTIPVPISAGLSATHKHNLKTLAIII